MQDFNWTYILSYYRLRYTIVGAYWVFQLYYRKYAFSCHNILKAIDLSSSVLDYNTLELLEI